MIGLFTDKISCWLVPAKLKQFKSNLSLELIHFFRSRENLTIKLILLLVILWPRAWYVSGNLFSIWSLVAEQFTTKFVRQSSQVVCKSFKSLGVGPQMTVELVLVRAECMNAFKKGVEKTSPFWNFVFAISMLQQSQILKILVCTPHNYGGIMGVRTRIRDHLSI